MNFYYQKAIKQIKMDITLEFYWENISSILCQCILKLCSQDISIHIVKEYAQCIIQQEKYFIISGENTKIEVDSAFITTGHNQNQNNFPMYSAYPLEISTQNISANDAIGIKGLGLSAIDVITMLTSGNGGFFEKLNNELIYNPSGKEPKNFCIF